MFLDGIYEQYYFNFYQFRLSYIECQDCKYRFYYPRSLCPKCSSRNIGVKQAKGEGKIISLTVFEINQYWSIVEMDEGFKLYLPVEADEPPKIGDRIHVKFMKYHYRVLPSCSVNSQY